MSFCRVVSFLPLLCGTLAAGACAPAQRRGDTQGTPAHAAGQESECTAALLGRTTPYDSSRVSELVGRYHFVGVDTVSGYAELRAKYAQAIGQVRPFLIDLWATDSSHRYWRTQWLTKARVATNRPIVGAIVGGDTTGFSADMPQIVIDGSALNSITIRFDSRMILDGDNVRYYPISVLGAWGFGGRFESGSLVVPAGVDGKPLPPEAGWYCAFRVAE